MPDTRMVESRLKPDNYGDCECGYERCMIQVAPSCLEYRYGRLRKPGKDGKRHVYDCRCPSCTGRRNRTKGDRKAARARKALNIGGVNSRHEELFGGALRVEVKAGAQVGPAVRAFKKCAEQSEAQRPVGDNRPFAAVWMPDGERDGVVAFRLSAAFEVAAALLENQAAS